MFLLDISSHCNDAALLILLSSVKKIMTLIQILAPILLILSASISIFQLMSNPERKNGTKGILNKVLAAVIIFFIPMFMNATMGLIGESSTFSSCWNVAGTTSTGSSYMDPNADTRKKSSVTGNSSDYEKGQKQATYNDSNSSSDPSSSHSSPSIAVPDPSSVSSNANKVIFVGDSRTVQMYAHVTGNWNGANYSSGGVHVVGNDVFIAQGSMGLSWLKSTGIPEAKKYFGSGSALIILMGVNDTGNVDSYISYLRENVSSWTSTGTRVYYSAVTPCDGNRISHNTKVLNFNSKLSRNLPSGITWIDTYSYLNQVGFTTTDGLHYNRDTSKIIYAYLKSQV